MNGRCSEYWSLIVLLVLSVHKLTVVLRFAPNERFDTVICIAWHIEMYITLFKLTWFVWYPHGLLSDSKICAIVICALIYVSEQIFHSRLLRTQWSTHLVHKVKSTKTFIRLEIDSLRSSTSFCANCCIVICIVMRFIYTKQCDLPLLLLIIIGSSYKQNTWSLCNCYNIYIYIHNSIIRFYLKTAQRCLLFLDCDFSIYIFRMGQLCSFLIQHT